jgi:hypothetical protein
MRLLELPSQARIQLDADPVWANEFLGPEPEFSSTDARVWDLYWFTRRCQPCDAMGGPLSLDLVRALQLNRDLFELDEPNRVVQKLQAMDSAYLANIHEQRERKAKPKGDR